MRFIPFCILFILCPTIFATAAEQAAFEGPSLIENLQAGKKQHIVFFGTSLTAGGAWPKQVVDALNAKYPNQVSLTNSGGSGMASDWGLANVDKKVIAMKPDAVFIEFAINDSATRYKISLETARKNLEQIIDRIQKANPDCQVILMTMDPAIGEPLARRNHVEDYYQNYRDVAKAKKLQLIDLYVPWKALLDKDPKTFSQYVPDGVHPTAEGCTKMITPNILAALMD